MAVYGYAQRAKEQNYFADVRHNDGASQWVHVRTNLGRKVAFAMIARHFDGVGKIVNFRDENAATAYDKQGIEQGSDGKLITNHWAGYSSAGESYAGSR